MYNFCILESDYCCIVVVIAYIYTLDVSFFIDNLYLRCRPMLRNFRPTSDSLDPFNECIEFGNVL